MNKLTTVAMALAAVALAEGLSAPVGRAQEENGRDKGPDIIFSTTYDCPEWTQGQGDPKIKGMAMAGGWTTKDGSKEQITADANYPGGGGGKGQRHWKGSDGNNINSGGIAVMLGRSEPELWIRWYMRYEKGFKWSPKYGGLPHYDKILYIHNDKESDPKGCQVVPEWYGDRFSVATQGAGTRAHECSKKGVGGWQEIMGGKESDGKWHCYEIHIKVSSEGKNDGIGEFWIDGKQYLSVRDASLPGKGWSWFLVGSNQNLPDNGRDMYVDYDDIAVSRTGPIGPIPAKAELKAAAERPPEK